MKKSEKSKTVEVTPVTEVFPDPLHSESLQEYICRSPEYGTLRLEDFEKPDSMFNPKGNPNAIRRERVKEALSSSTADRWRKGPACRYCGTPTNRTIKVCSNVQCETIFESEHKVKYTLAEQREANARALKEGTFSCMGDSDRGRKQTFPDQYP